MVSEGSKSSPDSSENAAQAARSGSRRRQKRATPLDETALRDLALSYAARFATTAAKVEAYLERFVNAGLPKMVMGVCVIWMLPG